MEKIKVYIASPYTNGNKEELAELQLDAAAILLKKGFNPYAPLYNHYIQEDHSELDHSFDWLGIDKSWLALCDIMIRIFPKDEKGEKIKSPGADEEEEFSRANGIPVFYFEDLSELEMWSEMFPKEKFFKLWQPLSSFTYAGHTALISTRCNIPSMARFQVKAEVKSPEEIKEILENTPTFYTKNQEDE
jgi:hypothetical protein